MSAEALAGLKAYWEGLTRERVAILDTVYAPEAYFRDPFNEVRGIEELRRIFAHMYETGGMRRTHLRGRKNILKRLLIHAVGFNLALLVRVKYGMGKPRTLQGVQNALVFAQAVLWALWAARCRPAAAEITKADTLRASRP